MKLKKIPAKILSVFKHSEKPPLMEIDRYIADGGDRKMRFTYPLNSESIVLDLGGYEGQWASDIFGRYACSVHVFEVIPQYAKNIEERFSANSKIRVYPYGLGGCSRTETACITGDSSSVYGDSENAVQIRLVDIKDWLAENGINKIDLLKINIEGGEYEVLERLLQADLVHMITDIQVQFHEIAADSFARMQAIRQGLSRTHSPTYQYDFIWDNWRLNSKAEEK